MKKEIEIVIENGGEMEWKMEGYEGSTCSDSLDRILIGDKKDAVIKKTADYHKRPTKKPKQKKTV